MELTSKQRAQLRGLANSIDTILQVGKDGIGANLIKQADDALEARELIKGRGAGRQGPGRGGAGHRHEVRAVPGEPLQAQGEAHPAGEAGKEAPPVTREGARWN